MLINKKFLALALLPLFGACVVNDSDDDTGAGTDTDVSTTMTTTTMSTTDTTTMSTTDTTTMSTTDTTTMSTTDTDSDTDADTSATDTDTTDTDTGGGGGFCALGCEAPEDCCNAADPNCIPGLGTYPYDISCEDNVCTYGGCTEDDQCTFGGVLVGYICDEGTGVCGFECADTAECQAQIGMETFECNGTYCEAPAGPGCESDDDCAGFGVCDVAAGTCGCAGDKDCGMEGYVCSGE